MAKGIILLSHVMNKKGDYFTEKHHKCSEVILWIRSWVADILLSDSLSWHRIILFSNVINDRKDSYASHRGVMEALL